MPPKNQPKIPVKKPLPAKGKQAIKPAPNPGFLNRQNKLYILAGLVLFTVILYGNTFQHDYALDDDIITRRNAFVQMGFGGIGKIFSKGFLYGFNRMNDQSYRPVTLTSIAIENGIFGVNPENPHVHHFFNVLYYAITAVFLFLVLLMIFRKYHYIIPLLITLLFIAHPVHTEVVANIKSRDEILSFLFCMLSLYCTLKYYLFRKPPTYLYLSWTFFFLAILCKETVLMYFIIIPMVYYFFTDYDIIKVIKIGAPYVCLVIVYMILRGSILDSITFNEKMEVVNNSLMAAHTGADRLATGILIMGKYLVLLFFPHPLSWDYSYKQIPVVSFTNLEAIIPLLAYGGLIAYAIYGLKKKDAVSFGILYYLITMLLVSNLLVKIGATMGERFLYTSSLGFCIAVVFLLVRLLKVQATVFKPNIKVISGIIGGILVVFSVATIARNNDWTNNFTLFSSGIETAPNSARVHESMAYALTDTAIKSKTEKEKNDFYNRAIQQYYATLKILPDYSEALYNLGWNFYTMGQEDSAKSAFQRCINVAPNYASAYQYMGVIDFNHKQYSEAIGLFYKTIALNPYDATTLGNLGAAYENIGVADSAIHYFQKALQIDPNLDYVRKNLASMQNKSGSGIK